ncbi:HEAT repeat domain-containing protein [Stackebrandtia soli]|uniref:HEAT repeat domain-containing protein n=1 Tax=Stackebrandtia soli TaxID=1892856 RepID=UPI0039E8004D
MTEPAHPERSPRALVAEARDKYGDGVIVRWCADLLRGRVSPSDPDSPSLGWIGGRHALSELRVGRIAERGQDYWIRTWAARAFLYVWGPEAIPAVCAGLSDPAWRVREMSAKVVRLREIGEAADLLPELADDETPRVRVAALRAIPVVAEAEAAEAIRGRLDDDDDSVRDAAETALARLSERLDREL